MRVVSWEGESKTAGISSPLLGGSSPFSKWLITMVSKSPKWGYSSSEWPVFGL